MLNWVIIGSGDVVNRLVKDSFNSKQSKVCYVYSKNFEEAKKVVKKYNYGEAINKLDIAIKDKNINCAYIATPPNDHYFYIKLLANKKINILCEKPLVLKKNNHKQIKKLCEKNKISFYGSFYRREQKRFLYVKKLIKENYIGKLIAFDYKMHHSLKTHPTAPIFDLKKNKIPWRFDKKISGGGNFLDMGLHVIDFLLDVFGSIKNYQSLKTNNKKMYNVEESLVINLIFSNSVIGQGSWYSTINERRDVMNIYGSKGSIQFSFNFNDKILIKKGKKIITKKIKMSNPAHGPLIRKVVKIFLDSIKKNKNYIDYKSLELTKFQNKIY